jgi:PAS domain-containing protein
MTGSFKPQLVASRSLIEDYPELIDNQHIPVLRMTIWVVLVGSVALTIALGISLGKASLWRMYFPVALIVLAVAAQLVLRYRGAVASVRLLAVGGWALATAAGIATEGVRTPILLAYPMILIFSGWALGARYGVGLFVASSIAIVAMAVGQSMGMIGRAVPFPPAIMALAHLIVLTISIAMTLYLLRSFRQSYAQYRLLTENIKDVVWIVDTETLHYRYVSPSVEMLRGYTPEELLAVPVTHALTADASEHLIGLIRSRSQNILLDEAFPRKYYTDEVDHLD